MARLFAQVFGQVDFAGPHRYLTDDISNLQAQLGFSGKVSSIIIYAGNEYEAHDVIRFYELPNFGGGYLELSPGRYANIHAAPYNFGDDISSADFRSGLPPVPGLGVRLHVRVFQQPNYLGQFRDILLSEPNFENIGFCEAVSSLRITAGEDYQPGWVANFYQYANFTGSVLAPGNFGPCTNLANLRAMPYVFNDRISSVRIARIA